MGRSPALLFLEAQTLELPPRPADALTGTEFAKRVSSLDLPDREQEIFAQITAGNVPHFLRKLAPVPAHQRGER